MPKVILISHTENPEKIIAAAAKLCYSASSPETLLENLSAEQSAKFVAMLAQLGHQSPIEHVSFTFGIEGVSRAFLAQITRHRIASFSVQSQRYVKGRTPQFIVPPEVQKSPEARELFEQAMESAYQSYHALADILEKKHAAALMEQGLDEKTAMQRAEKMAIEDARFVLPNASETKMIVTMNARSLLGFFGQRCCNRAQWEIRDVANQMLALVHAVAPTLFAAAGPGCVSGPCPEGKMCCGKMAEVRTYYQNLKRNDEHEKKR